MLPLLTINLHLLTGYKVVIALTDGSEMVFTLEPQFSVVLPKPSGGQDYTVSVIAINEAGSSEPQEATITGRIRHRLGLSGSALVIDFMSLINTTLSSTDCVLSVCC